MVAGHSGVDRTPVCGFRKLKSEPFAPFLVMLKTVLLYFLTLSIAGADDSALRSLDRAVTPLIQQYFPGAEVKRTDTSYAAKHDTMEFTVHGSSKTGQIAAETHKEEGPNHKGFFLQIDLCDGPYQGAAVIPQHLKRPYWTTFIDALSVPGQNKHLMVRFSYGGNLSAEFQKSALAALAKR